MSFIKHTLVATTLLFSITVLATPAYAASSDGFLQQLAQMNSLLERLQQQLLGQVVSVTNSSQSLFTAGDTPGTLTTNDTNAVTLGVRFQSATAGTVTSIRFYKGPNNTGTHTVVLWNVNGTELARQTSSGETNQGWQTVVLNHPITIQANTTYVAGYYAPTGNYSSDNNYFGTSHTMSDLMAPSDAGVYQYGDSPTFPTQTYKNSNYWVDVVFVPTPVVVVPPVAPPVVVPPVVVPPVVVPPVITATTPSQNFLGNATPATLTDVDTHEVTLGLRFQSAKAGMISAVRFYKGPNNKGTHTVAVWDQNGKQLVRQTATSETAEGWQTVSFPQALPISANTTYTVGYYTPKGNYSTDSNYFTGPRTSGDLRVQADAGLYQYGPLSYPTLVYNHENYWVDVVFVANPSVVVPPVVPPVVVPPVVVPPVVVPPVVTPPVIVVPPPVVVPTVVAKFAAGSMVKATAVVKVRSSGSRSATVMGKQQVGAIATVLGTAPVSSGGYVWIPVDFVTGADGFVAQDFVAAYVPPVVPPVVVPPVVVPPVVVPPVVIPPTVTSDVSYSCVRNFYVATNGSDSSTGSITAPWKTVGSAVNNATIKAGDCINVGDGTYTENTINLGRGGNADTATGYVVLRAINKGKALLRPTASAFNVLVPNANYLIIDGFDIANAVGSGITASNVHHVKIANNTVYNSGEGGIQFNYSEYETIVGNILHDNAKDSWFSGISIYENRNLSGNTTDTGFRNIVRNNISYNNLTLPAGGPHTDGNGIIIDDFNYTQNAGVPYPYKTLVENNLVFGNGGKGIQLAWSNNVTVRNNTAYANNRDLNNTGTWRGELNDQASGNNIWVNNIGVTDTSINSNNSAIGDQSTPGGGTNVETIWRNNLTFNLKAPGNVSVITQDGSTAVINAAGGNILGVDPKFTAPGVTVGANFTLLPASPAIGKGSSAYGVSATDLAGNSRSSSSVNIGAY